MKYLTKLEVETKYKDQIDRHPNGVVDKYKDGTIKSMIYIVSNGVDITIQRVKDNELVLIPIQVNSKVKICSMSDIDRVHTVLPKNKTYIRYNKLQGII